MVTSFYECDSRTAPRNNNNFIFDFLLPNQLLLLSSLRYSLEVRLGDYSSSRYWGYQLHLTQSYVVVDYIR